MIRYSSWNMTQEEYDYMASFHDYELWQLWQFEQINYQVVDFCYHIIQTVLNESILMER